MSERNITTPTTVELPTAKSKCNFAWIPRHAFTRRRQETFGLERRGVWIFYRISKHRPTDLLVNVIIRVAETLPKNIPLIWHNYCFRRYEVTFKNIVLSQCMRKPDWGDGLPSIRASLELIGENKGCRRTAKPLCTMQRNMATENDLRDPEGGHRPQCDLFLLGLASGRQEITSSRAQNIRCSICSVQVLEKNVLV